MGRRIRFFPVQDPIKVIQAQVVSPGCVHILTMPNGLKRLYVQIWWGAKVSMYAVYAVLKEVLNKCKRKGNTGTSSVNMLCRTDRPAGQLTGDGAAQNNLESSIVRQNADFLIII